MLRVKSLVPPFCLWFLAVVPDRHTIQQNYLMQLEKDFSGDLCNLHGQLKYSEAFQEHVTESKGLL